jgi:hypothetical protein
MKNKCEGNINKNINVNNTIIVQEWNEDNEAGGETGVNEQVGLYD